MQKTGDRNQLQYISYLLNLEYAIKCEAWVCTIMSNTCRIIDELRSTVGGKANRAFIDLSKETCKSPPCGYSDSDRVMQFDWRRRK